MKITGKGGTLKLGGTLVAQIGSWEMDGGGAAKSYVGIAHASAINSYYMEHGDGFTLHLAIGERIMKGRCLTAVLDEDGMLHFHIKRA
jgi:hypothetical protein